MSVGKEHDAQWREAARREQYIWRDALKLLAQPVEDRVGHGLDLRIFFARVLLQGSQIGAVLGAGRAPRFKVFDGARQAVLDGRAVLQLFGRAFDGKERP